MNHITRRRFRASVIRIADRHLKRPALTDPLFNFREILKQFVLLEDHLTHEYKVCPDCIRKHLLTVEALSEEIEALAPGTIEASTGASIAELMRLWQANYEDGRPIAELARDVRQIRKQMAQDFADPRVL